MANINRPLDGYPTPIGSVKLSIFPHIGPTNYTQATLVAGSVPTNGDTILASEGGLKYLDSVQDAMTDDGMFNLLMIPTTPSNNPGGAAPTPGTTFKAMWIANKTASLGGQNQTVNTEAVAGTNLSTFVARLTAIGTK